MISKNGFIIGNGESREEQNLGQLFSYGKIYGCNAFYRDFMPDVLVIMDEDMIKEVIKSDFKGNIIYRDKSDTSNLKMIYRGNKEEISFNTIHDDGWSCGPTATKLLCYSYHHYLKNIFLIGMDLYSTDDKINNKYKGTDCYDDKDALETWYGNWTADQFPKVFKEYSNINFYRVGDNKLFNIMPDEWKEFKNIKNISYKEMWSILNG